MLVLVSYLRYKRQGKGERNDCLPIPLPPSEEGGIKGILVPSEKDGTRINKKPREKAGQKVKIEVSTGISSSSGHTFDCKHAGTYRELNGIFGKAQRGSHRLNSRDYDPGGQLSILCIRILSRNSCLKYQRLMELIPNQSYLALA